MSFRPQVEPSHYDTFEYNNKDRLISYGLQVSEIVRLKPSTVLEVGIGNGFVSKYLKSLGFAVHTCDADVRLNPDTVGELEHLPFGEAQFDVVCCFETLEHLPWKSFGPATRELARVARRSVLLSLPDVTPYFRLNLEFGFKHSLCSFFYDLPLAYKKHDFNGEHYWEVGKRGWPLRRIVRELKASGLVVESTFRAAENPWHRFIRCNVR